MDTDSLLQHLGQDYKDAVKSVQVKQAQTKDGSSYTYLSIIFINGYEYRAFLKSEQKFCVHNAFEQLRTQKVVDAAF